MQKKREILPKINACITALVEMHRDAATLELVDNDQASRRLKSALKDFKEMPLTDLTDIVLKTRMEINAIPAKKINTKDNPIDRILSVKQEVAPEVIERFVPQQKQTDQIILPPEPPAFEF